MASLTETAKAVLEGKKLEEGYGSNPYPSVGNGGVSNPDPVDPSTASTGNAKTLRPKSKSSEPDPKHNEAADLGGQTPTTLPSGNLGAAAAGATSKDTSKVTQGATAAEPAKKLSEDEEVDENTLSLAERVKALKEARKMKSCSMEEGESTGVHAPDKPSDKEKDMMEDIELSEELEAFIEEGIEAGLSEEEILAAIDENFEFVSEETEEESIEEALETYEVDMAEHVNALLEGEDLSEEFQAKATTIFEAAVKAKLEEEVALLEQAYAETLEERVEEIMEELASNVDDYLNYVVEQWIAENEVAVESALRSELTEDFISGLRSLFAEHYIDVPEEEVHVVEELSSTVEELEAKLNEEIQRNVELTSMLAESRKVELAATVCEGLTDTQAQKLLALVENVEYTDDTSFVEKISTLKENYFPTVVKADAVLDRVESADPQTITEENLNGPMAKYVKALGKSLPK